LVPGTITGLELPTRPELVRGATSCLVPADPPAPLTPDVVPLLPPYMVGL
jgi:hypothetical protein